MDNKPNFLFFITDQHRADHLGCYGNPVVKTPNIDGLAARGTRFDRFYTATPICMPNRATLMTGRMPSLHGARHNGIPLSMNATTFVDIMGAAGYDTALIGKCHLQSISGSLPTFGMPEPDPNKVQPPERLREADRSWLTHGRYDQELRSTWRDDADFELTLPYYGFSHVELAVGHGDAVVGHYERWLNARHGDAESLRGRKNQLAGNDYVAPQAWRTRVPEELYPTSYVAERTIAYLEQHALAGAKPFFIQCSFPDPHHPFTPPGKYWDMYDPREVNLPPSYNTGEHPLPPHLQQLYIEREQGKANRDGQRTIAVTEREAREAIALTYGMITMIDDAVGRILQRLGALGLSENTVVIFNADHGDFMGDHQLLLKGALHYQALVRVPFIWRDPAAKNHGLVNTGLCGPSIWRARSSIAPISKAITACKALVYYRLRTETKPATIRWSSKNTSGAAIWALRITFAPGHCSPKITGSRCMKEWIGASCTTSRTIHWKPEISGTSQAQRTRAMN